MSSSTERTQQAVPSPPHTRMEKPLGPCRSTKASRPGRGPPSARSNMEAGSSSSPSRERIRTPCCPPLRALTKHNSGGGDAVAPDSGRMGSASAVSPNLPSSTVEDADWFRSAGEEEGVFLGLVTEALFGSECEFVRPFSFRLLFICFLSSLFKKKKKNQKTRKPEQKQSRVFSFPECSVSSKMYFHP